MTFTIFNGNLVVYSYIDLVKFADQGIKIQNYFGTVGQFAENLKGEPDAEGISLFGSVADGKINENSKGLNLIGILFILSLWNT